MNIIKIMMLGIILSIATCSLSFAGSITWSVDIEQYHNTDIPKNVKSREFMREVYVSRRGISGMTSYSDSGVSMRRFGTTLIFQTFGQREKIAGFEASLASSWQSLAPTNSPSLPALTLPEESAAEIELPEISLEDIDQGLKDPPHMTPPCGTCSETPELVIPVFVADVQDVPAPNSLIIFIIGLFSLVAFKYRQRKAF